MTERDLEVDVYEFLQRIQLEQFFEKLDKVLHLTRLSHFDHVAESDLNGINMSKPEQRRLFDAIKKHKKERKKVSKLRFSLRKSKKKESALSSNESGVKHGQAKSCLITESSLKLLGVLGDGAFGVVSKGEWTPNKGSKVSVAVKCLKFSDKDALVKEQDNFMHEARAMSDLDHPNVIHLYGIVLATPIKLVMELAALGSLQDRLRTEPQKFLISTLYDFVLQIASGMSYLESKRYVHRDLAARNILLASYDKVKIGDFGLMRLLPSEDEIYVMNPLGKVAVAWCAPECLKNREFSHASDVWAFGVTVIEIFSYGKQPWDGLSGVQILDIIDEPANGRPGKPDRCPDKLYSLLFEHCWDPNPKDRSRFSSIQAKLQEEVPQDVTLFFDLKNDSNPDSLVAKSGDLVTVITWKSRLGTEFAKGQNKRTAEVGYFPISQASRHNCKSKSSASKPRIAKVKDISPPLDNSFSHIAHRGHGETPNWGTIMSDDRQVLGKHRPLNLPVKYISLNNSDSESQIEGYSGEMDSCSLVSRDSSISLAHRSCADSGYYSNRDTFMSQDYELMTGSNPIAIPNSYVKSAMPTGIPSTFMPAQHLARCPSGASLQFDPYNGQRCRGDSFGSDTARPQQCPAIPAKLRVVGSDGNIKVSIGFPGNKEKPENPYENLNEISGSNYEHMQRPSSLTHRVIEEPLMSSSPESVYENNKDTKSAESLGFINMNYPIIYDRPTTDNLFICPQNGRCNSFPEFDMRKKITDRNFKRRSFSSEKDISFHSLNESKSAPILDRQAESIPNSKNWETRTADEAMSEDIYENIEIYNVPQAIMSDIPPPLPLKRRYSRRGQSFQRNSGLHGSSSSKKMALSHEALEEHYSRPVSLDVTPNFDSHLYAEISDQLIKELNLDDQNELNENTSLEETNEEVKSSFKEISKDYADLDEICAKLRENTTIETQSAENANEADDMPCPVVPNEKPSKTDDVLWKRFSTDQRRIQQFRRDKRSSFRSHDRPKINHFEKRRLSDCSSRSSSNSLKHPCGEQEAVQSLHGRTTLVTTV